MGSGFYTFDEAASRLKRSKRSVHNYIKNGFIKREIVNGKPVLDRDDVDHLAVDQGADSPALNRKTFFQMQSRLQKLENQMRTVLHMLEIRDDPLRFTDSHQASGYFKGASDSLTRSKVWSIEEVGVWASQLEKMDEVSIEYVCRVMGDNKSWAPFFRLCTEMLEYAVAQDKAKPSLEWQALRKRLDEARRKLRAAIVIWVEMGKGSSSEALLGLMDDPKTALIRRLGQ